jgi:hypothetical protein
MGEVYLVFTAYNLRRALSVYFPIYLTGFDTLMSRIYAHIQSFKQYFYQYIDKISFSKPSKFNYEFLLLKIE